MPLLLVDAMTKSSKLTEPSCDSGHESEHVEMADEADAGS